MNYSVGSCDRWDGCKFEEKRKEDEGNMKDWFTCSRIVELFLLNPDFL